MRDRGYSIYVLRKKLHRHLHRFYYLVGDLSPARLNNDIWYDYTSLASLQSQGYAGWEYLQSPNSQEGGSDELSLDSELAVSAMSAAGTTEDEELVEVDM
jgi:hypothetical protein